MISSDTICEPIEVDPVRAVRASRVRRASPAPAPERFSHFHDLAELVWFGEAAGHLLTAEGRVPLGPGTAIYIPSMHPHDFVIAPGRHHWIVAHIDPSMISAMALNTGARSIEQSLIVRFAPAQRERVAMLFDWLVESAQSGNEQGATIGLLVELIMVALGDAIPAIVQGQAELAPEHDRLRPALDRIARDPAAPMTLTQAASLCHLSESYFSRRFKAVFGTNFAEYVRGYRLRLAARRLLTSGARIADIGYEIGFASPAHFTATFRARYGVSPRHYRANAKNVGGGQADDSI